MFLFLPHTPARLNRAGWDNNQSARKYLPIAFNDTTVAIFPFLLPLAAVRCPKYLLPDTCLSGLTLNFRLLYIDAYGFRGYALSCPVLPCPTLSCPALPCPVLASHFPTLLFPSVTTRGERYNENMSRRNIAGRHGGLSCFILSCGSIRSGPVRCGLVLFYSVRFAHLSVRFLVRCVFFFSNWGAGAAFPTDIPCAATLFFVATVAGRWYNFCWLATQRRGTRVIQHRCRVFRCPNSCTRVGPRTTSD